jgi:RND family efflux transporter MFP subunit
MWFQRSQEVVLMMRRRFWAVAGLILVVALVLTIAFHGSRRGESVEAAPGPPAAQVVRVERGNISHVLTLAGQFQPYQVVEVHPKVSGFIRKIFVDIGDRVHKGETLAILEIPELQAQYQGTVSEVARSRDEITRAKHEVARAESEHSAIHSDYERMKETAQAQPGLIAQQELDDAQAKDLASEAQVDAAKAAYSAAEQGAEVARAHNQQVGALQSYAQVTAPLDGVITWRYADTGALIQTGTNSNVQSLPIVKLSQSDLLRLRVPVPEADVRFVHVGDPMSVRVDALGRSFSGKVVRFTRNISPSTRTMDTEIDVPNRDLNIDPGMYANTQLQLDHAENVPTLPVEAVVDENGRKVVYAVDSDNRIHIRPVALGLQGSVLDEIRSGVQIGDRVILGGQNKYQDGEEIQPVLNSRTRHDVTRQAGGEIDLHDQNSQQGGEQ